MTAFKFIAGGCIYDNIKRTIVTCPFNKHEYCRFSCPMICLQTTPEGLQCLSFGCCNHAVAGDVEGDPHAGILAEIESLTKKYGVDRT